MAANPIFDSYIHSDPFGKAIFLALFALSILTWFIFLQKYLFQKEIRKQASSIREQFGRKWQNPLTVELKNSDHPYYVLWRTLKQDASELIQKNHALHQDKKAFLTRNDLQLLEKMLDNVVTVEIKRFEQNLFHLSTVITLAPFLGLLGTVWGILLTFAELQHGAIANANALVMSGLAMALGTTVVGLLVAIPALLAYNYLKNRLGDYGEEVEDFSKNLVLSLERHFHKADEQK